MSEKLLANDQRGDLIQGLYSLDKFSFTGAKIVNHAGIPTMDQRIPHQKLFPLGYHSPLGAMLQSNLY